MFYAINLLMVRSNSCPPHSIFIKGIPDKVKLHGVTSLSSDSKKPHLWTAADKWYPADVISVYLQVFQFIIEHLQSGQVKQGTWLFVLGCLGPLIAIC